MSNIFQKPFSNDTSWSLSLLQLVIIHSYIVIVSEVVIHEFSQNWNEIYQCITSHTVENIYQCIGKFSVINDYYFLYLFALLWRKPCQCKGTHLLEKPYKCICLQDISYQYIVPSSLEKPYQCRNYDGQISSNEIIFPYINMHHAENVTGITIPLERPQKGYIPEKINHCISLINDLLFLFNKMKKYTISHIVNRLINVYSLYRIGRSIFITFQYEYVR